MLSFWHRAFPSDTARQEEDPMKTCPVCDTPYPVQHSNCPGDGTVLIVTHELEPGHIVGGKYRILPKLGPGRMGIVYLAEHMLLLLQSEIEVRQTPVGGSTAGRWLMM
jgi:hypothetical protein